MINPTARCPVAEVDVHHVCDDVVQHLFATSCQLEVLVEAAVDLVERTRLTEAIDEMGECIAALRSLLRATSIVA